MGLPLAFRSPSFRLAEIAFRSEEAGQKRDELLGRAEQLEREAREIRRQAAALPYLCPAAVANQRLVSVLGVMQLSFLAASAELDAAVAAWKLNNPSPAQ